MTHYKVKFDRNQTHDSHGHATVVNISNVIARDKIYTVWKSRVVYYNYELLSLRVRCI